MTQKISGIGYLNSRQLCILSPIVNEEIS